MMAMKIWKKKKKVIHESSSILASQMLPEILVISSRPSYKIWNQLGILVKSQDVTKLKWCANIYKVSF